MANATVLLWVIALIAGFTLAAQAVEQPGQAPSITTEQQVTAPSVTAEQQDTASSITTEQQVTAPSVTAETAETTAGMDESSFDVRIFRLLNGSLINPFFDRIMPVVTDFNRWRIVVLLVWSALVIFGKQRERWAALMLIPLVFASDQITSHVIKPLIARARPCEVLGKVHLWYGPQGWITTPVKVFTSYKSSFSFPSSHAANITAEMLFLGLAFRRWLIPLLALALLVSYSRIYIGVHWPSDVAAGIMIGALLAWPAFLIFKRIGGTSRSSKNPGESA